MNRLPTLPCSTAISPTFASPSPESCQSLATEAARKELSHLDYLAQLAEGEASLRQDRAVARRIKAARFPPIKISTPSAGTGLRKSTALSSRTSSVSSLPQDKANVIFLGLVGLGKTHLATALGYAACLRGQSVLFANAIDVINTLSAAQNKGSLKAELRKYLSPSILLLDEVGYLPIDQRGADLLFQVISQRYERGSIVLTTTKPSSSGPNLQRRQHHYLRRPRPPSPPRRNRPYRRHKLPYERPRSRPENSSSRFPSCSPSTTSIFKPADLHDFHAAARTCTHGGYRAAKNLEN